MEGKHEIGETEDASLESLSFNERLHRVWKILKAGTVVDHATRVPGNRSSLAIQAHPQARTSDLEALTPDRSAVYLGPLLRTDIKTKWQRFIDYRGERGVYSEESMLAVLREAAVRCSPESPLKVVLVQGLRPFCNPPDENYLSTEDLAEKIRALCQRFLKIEPHVTTLEDECPDLFSALRTQTTFTETAAEWNTHRIANVLHQACRDHRKLRKAMRGCMPRRLRELLPSMDEDLPPVELYTLFETAIHLSQSLQGRFIQFGVGRQEEFNKIVIELLKGREGKFANAAALHELFDVLTEHSCRFLGVNVDTTPNPAVDLLYRTRARALLVLAGAFSTGVVTAVGVTYGLTKHAETVAEEQRLASVKASGIREVYGDLECRDEDGAVLSFEEKSARVEQRMDEMRKLLEIKYGMKWSEEEWEGAIEMWILDFLRVKKRKNGSEGICEKLLSNPEYLHTFLEDFVKHRKVSFEFQSFSLVPYAQLADDLALPIRKEPWTYCMSSPYQMMYDPRITEVGQFIPEDAGPDGAVSLYRVSGVDEEDFLVTRDATSYCFLTKDVETLVNYVHEFL